MIRSTALALWFVCLFTLLSAQPLVAQQVPQFQVDPAWPKPLPNNWIIGQIGGIAVDSHDRIWVYQRPNSLTDDERGAALKPPVSKCCVPAPSVMQFDQEGNLLQAWGGPGAGYDWPKSEHGIYVDKQDNVWLAGNDKDNDHMVLKFSADGRFLMQIGKAGKTAGSNSAKWLGRPAMAVVDEYRGELYVADGYKNRRIIVFDPKTGEYRRHWGAYGAEPNDYDLGAYNPSATVAKQFRTPVHCVRISNDEFVYVCDRTNNRIQVFRKSGGFLKEFVIEPATRGAGSVWDIVFSNDAEQKYLFVADGTNNEIHIVLRENGEKLASFGRAGRMAGQFHWVHAIAIDSNGNLYTGDVDTGKRVQKFTRLQN
jgi:sugar lactone lactonase YvrE